MVNFLAYDVVTKIRLEDEVPMQFPRISICNINPVHTEKAYQFTLDLFSRYNISKSLYNTQYETMRYFITTSMNNPSINDSEKKKFQNSMHEMLLECRFNRNECNANDFEWFFNGLYAGCYSFASKGDKYSSRSKF
jgi:hypothetical protein